LHSLEKKFATVLSYSSYVFWIEKSVEGKWLETLIDPDHVCRGRQRYRLCWSIDHGSVGHRHGVAVHINICVARIIDLAIDGDHVQHCVRTISFL